MEKKESYLRLRIYLVFGLFIVFFGGIFARAFHLQVLESASLKEMAARQHSRTISVRSRRGEIYDRNLKELAVSIEVDSVYAQPVKVPSPRAAAEALAPILSVSRKQLERRLGSGAGFVWLKRQIDLSDEQRAKVREIAGVSTIKESKRFYPNRRLASNLIGFTGLDADGLEGLELRYNSRLKGASHKFIVNRDARGSLMLFEDVDKLVPVQGMEVELTIDKTIQYVAEKALSRAVEGSGAASGMALVMDPSTGEVLAMASYPTYDPNAFSEYRPGEWRNRAVTDTFEPGSILKTFLISAAVEEGAVSPREIFFCENGTYRVADRTFHDTTGHGWLSVSQILKYSSNIGAAKIGERLGKARLYRYLKAFGFGTRSGVDLPGETRGSLKSPSKWSDVTLQTISFGQGISVTGIQLVTALSAVANGGYLMKPYIVKSIKDPSGRVMSEGHPVIVRRVISADTARKLTRMLVGVTGEGGTGTLAALDGFEVAGKTATAQKPDLVNGGYSDDAYFSSFFGFVPASRPRLAILVSVDEPKRNYYGGKVAAPAFREIAAKSLAYLGVFPGSGRSAPIRLVRASSARGFEEIQDESGRSPMAVPDFSGRSIRMVMRMARARAMDVELNGSGRAYSQSPAPGRSVPEKGPVVVRFH